MKLLILVTLLLTGCEYRFTALPRDEALLPYVKAFEKEFNVEYVGGYSFSDTWDRGDQFLAYCEAIIHNPNTTVSNIVVKRKGWDEQSEFNKEIILFNQLGHCALGIDEHHDEMKDNVCPASLMNTYKIPEYCYKKFKQEYFDKLKQGY